MAKVGYLGIDGVNRKVKKSYIGIDGVARNNKKGYIGNKDGITREWLSSGVSLSALAVGSSVFMNVNGTPRAFIVVHQGNPDTSKYDVSCDGTWLAMKGAGTTGYWGKTSQYNYPDSTIHSYLNTTELNKFDDNIKELIKDVKLPYINVTGDSLNNYARTTKLKENGIPAKIFALSAVEVGGISTDGSRLSYFTSNSARIYGYTDMGYKQFTRTPYFNLDAGVTGVVAITESGGFYYNWSQRGSITKYITAMILPSDTLVDENFNVI